MLSSITWGQYISTVALLLICYYIYVSYKYFRWEILGLIGIKKVDAGTLNTPVSELKKQFISENHNDYIPKSVNETDISPLVNSFMDEAKAYLQATREKISKQELLHSFQQIVQKYPVLLSADCKDELIQFLFSEADALHSGAFQLQDIQQLWP